MIKLKVSKKSIKEDALYVIGVNYCKIQYMLYYDNALFYSVGQYGWSSDHYVIKTDLHDNVIVSTGYNYIKNKNVSYNIDDLQAYEDKARSIINDYTILYGDRKNIVNDLLNDFINNKVIYN